MSLEKNKAAVTAFYDLMFNQSKPADAIRRYVGASYTQHNPVVADGKQASSTISRGWPANIPASGSSSVRAGGGQLRRLALLPALAHGRDWAGIDIFRLDDDGKIVEHWDVLQRIPNEAANANTMF